MTRAELEHALAVGDDPWQPWQQVYRNLRAMGRWDESLAEALRFLAYARREDQKPARYSMHYGALTDVGDIYLALGDYDTALVYREELLRVARDYTEWRYASGLPDDPRPHVLERELANICPGQQLERRLRQRPRRVAPLERDPTGLLQRCQR